MGKVGGAMPPNLKLGGSGGGGGGGELAPPAPHALPTPMSRIAYLVNQNSPIMVTFSIGCTSVHMHALGS